MASSSHKTTAVAFLLQYMSTSLIGCAGIRCILITWLCQATAAFLTVCLELPTGDSLINAGDFLQQWVGHIAKNRP